MDDNGQASVAGDAQLFGEDSALRFSRRQVVVIIEPFSPSATTSVASKAHERRSEECRLARVVGWIPTVA
jgi:hypothetical protein